MKIPWTPPLDLFQPEDQRVQASPRDSPPIPESDEFWTAKNNLKSDLLRCEINKGIAADMPLQEVCLKLLECVSLMTGDTAFFDQNAGCINGKSKQSNEEANK